MMVVEYSNCDNQATNVTFYNVTGLLLGTTYELTVVAISEGGNITARSPESDSVE